MAAKFNIYCDEPVVNNQKHQPFASSTTANSISTNSSNTLTSSSATTATTTTTSSGPSDQNNLISNKAAELATATLAYQQQQLNAIAAKREPLGLRQQLTQYHQQQKPLSQQSSQGSSAAATAVVASKQDEDQENDISMASLGSDFVPSIVHDADFDSFEYDDDDDDEIINNSNDSHPSHDKHQIGDEAITHQNEHDFDQSLLVDDDEEFEEYDDELRQELIQAFKKNDDSQLFKSIVYIDDIENYLHELETTPELRALPGYMTFQPDIDSTKRAILINWLVEVAGEYDLESETLFICVNLIDRFLSQMSLPTSNLQLLGVAAMFIASKYEEIYPPYLYQFVEVTDDTYSGKQIRKMEQEILKALDFRISMPTVIYFLNRIFAYNKFSEKCYHMAEYLCYLSLLADEPFLEYHPSEIALAAVILAAHQIDAQSQNISSELRSAYDKSNQAQLDRRQTLCRDGTHGAASKQCDIDRRAVIADKDLPFCIESLREMQERAFTRSPRRQSTDSAIYTKFSTDSHHRVATLQPPPVEELYKLA